MISLEKQREYNKKSYLKHREERLAKIKIYDKQNREKKNKWYKERRESNPLFKLKTNIARGIKKSLNYKGIVKKDKTLSILGCNIKEFRNHLESQFEPWMNWKNYGKYLKDHRNYGWDIDHIIPVSSAKNEEEMIKLNHYTNLKPLCSYINRYIKKDNYVQIL